MKIITDGYYEGDTVFLDEVTCTYLQEPDCTEDRDGDPQVLKLSTRDGGGGKFINICTENWSIGTENDFEEFINVLKDFQHRFNDTFRSKSKNSGENSTED